MWYPRISICFGNLPLSKMLSPFISLQQVDDSIHRARSSSSFRSPRNDCVVMQQTEAETKTAETAEE